ncbi:MAG: hypothetical protein IKB98_01770 [Clostridia bacterium]|nr:hypothetical protein [Clostridia bacterium]
MKNTTNEKYEALKNALERAKIIAEHSATADDGGTCNFDSPTLDYRAMGMSKQKATEVIKSVGLGCYDWTFGRTVFGLVIVGMTKGQGNCRTAMAEAFCKSLQADGIKSDMYYQMD